MREIERERQRHRENQSVPREKERGERLSRVKTKQKDFARRQRDEGQTYITDIKWMRSDTQL